MSLQYISHMDPKGRQRGIVCVQQSIDDTTCDSANHMPKITHNLDKGKGHVFQFEEEIPRLKRGNFRDGEAASSAPVIDSNNLSLTGFRTGTFMGTFYAGNSMQSKKSRRMPTS